MTCTVANGKSAEYYDKEEVKQLNTKKGRKDKENYYEESGKSLGFYAGDGSDMLGLSGKVNIGDLSLLISGVNPKTKEKLFNQRYSKSYFTDACLSAPKDFTMLAEFDINNKNKYVDIFNNACNEAIKEISEKCYSRTSNKKNIYGLKLIQLYFDHKTARPLKDRRPDPQWHRHVITIKKCLDKNGDFRTIDNYPIFNNQKLFGAIFRKELANGLRELGFEIIQNKEEIIDDNFKRVKVNSFKVKGITEEQRNKFSGRTIEINAVAKDGATSLDKYNISQNIKRSKVVYDKTELENIWKKDAINVGITESFINSLKTYNTKECAINGKLEQTIIKQSLTKGRLYESKLLLKLAEYEQFTGINYKKHFNRLVENKSIEKIGRYEFKVNLMLENADVKQKQYNRRALSDIKFYNRKMSEYKHSVNNKLNIFKSFNEVAAMSFSDFSNALKKKTLLTTLST